MTPALVRATIPHGMGDLWLLCPHQPCQGVISYEASQGQDFACPFCRGRIEVTKARVDDAEGA